MRLSHSLINTVCYCVTVTDRASVLWCVVCVVCFALYRTLRHFSTSSDEYSVIFVSSCTAALKLVAESFQFIETLPESCDDDDDDDDDRISRNRSARRVTNSTPNVDGVYGQNPVGDSEKFPRKCQRVEEVLRRIPVDDRHDLGNATKPVSTTEAVACSDSAAAAAADDDDDDDDDDDGNRVRDISVTSCEWNCAPLLKSTFLYLADNHTSVVGMRCVVSGRGAQFRCVHADDVGTFLSSLQHHVVTKPSPSSSIRSPTSSQSATVHVPLSRDYVINSLFAYPAQSNFSGRRYPLEWVSAVQCGSDGLDTLSRPFGTHPRWYVLLDAAALLTTSTLDLSVHKPDFVVLSFYKMFGFPTGLGMPR